MEDSARLALVEQRVRNANEYRYILYELLHNFNDILDNPHFSNSRQIKCDFLRNVIACQELNDYLGYIGFRWLQNEYVYPKDQSLGKLRIAKSAIERKLSYCYGSKKPKFQLKQYELKPINVMMTTNTLILQIQSLFNKVLIYEDKQLQRAARAEIPMVLLELRALNRMRERQRKIKIGETKDKDLSYDIALLMELIGWFKYKYFSWVDEPSCDTCDGTTKFHHTTTLKTEVEICKVEVYICDICRRFTNFTRHNDVRALMRTRRGRCGEWANCFAMFCRALGYDTRYIYNSTDHVWCEVFDCDNKKWLHVDPCEAALDTPLIYSHGWGVKLSYVIGISCDDIQDVTWRYTTDHKEVLSRRTQCTEQELIASFLTLREHRQAQVSPARRKWLTKRTLQELAQLMIERDPSAAECYGRISGSADWRLQRGELGPTQLHDHIFEFDQPGDVNIGYCCSENKYRISKLGDEIATLAGWETGVYHGEHVFRNVEEDWRQVYIARKEGQVSGRISWKLSAKGDLVFTSLTVQVSTAVFDNGKINWTVQFDDHHPNAADFNDAKTVYNQSFKEVTLTAILSGGKGNVSWQHAQLFRQSLDSTSNCFEICAHISDSD